MITITGLTTQQKTLCDIIWACESQEQVTAFVSTLRGSYRKDAVTMLNMMIAATFDQPADIMPETVELLDKFRI